MSVADPIEIDVDVSCTRLDMRPPGAAGKRSRRGTFLKWLRKVHDWVELWGAALGLLFGTIPAESSCAAAAYPDRCAARRDVAARRARSGTRVAARAYAMVAETTGFTLLTA